MPSGRRPSGRWRQSGSPRIRECLAAAPAKRKEDRRVLSEPEAVRSISIPLQYPGIFTQKNADGILLLSDLLLEVGNLFRSGIHQLLGLANIEQGTESVLFERLSQL